MRDDEYIEMKQAEGQPSNKEWLGAIKKYQSCPFVHPLTCGNDSGHDLLKGIVIKGKVMLICPDCDYTQNWIPEYVFTAEDIDKAMELDFNEIYRAVKTDE